MRGISAVLWPLAALIVVLTFRAEISDLLRRLRRGKLLGQEIELDKSLDVLERGAEELASKPLPPLESVSPTEAAGRDPESRYAIEGEVANVLELAAQSPKSALMLLSANIEREARRLLAATGHSEEVPRTASLRAMVEVLEKATSLQRGTLDVVRNFAEVRNRIVHGHQDVQDDEILRAIDAGLIIYRSIAIVPREWNVVHHPGVALFSDPGASDEVRDVYGVILQTTSGGGTIKSTRIFPTTRRHFQRGRDVAWEWNLDKKWGPMWYRDPDNGEIRQAWDASLEFVGRHLDEV